MCVFSEALGIPNTQTNTVLPLHSAHIHTLYTHTHTLSPHTHALNMYTHTHCDGVHTHRATPCFPSAVSALHFTTPLQISSPTQKTLPAPISLTTPLSLTHWSYPASGPFLSPSLTTSRDLRLPHVPRPHPLQLSKGGVKLKPQLRHILVIYLDLLKD